MSNNERFYPRGQIRADDQGQLRMALFIHDHTVVLGFGKTVAWLGFGAEDAERLGQALIDKARELRGKAL